MVSKALVAVVAIAAVTAAGIGVFLFMNNGEEPVPLDVDYVRTDLRVGDYLEVNMDITAYGTWTDEDRNAAALTSVIYKGSPIGEKTTKTIVYKGQKIVCDYYTDTDGTTTVSYAIDPDTGVTYQYTKSGRGDNCTFDLKDTNLDLTLEQEDQKVSSGSFIIADFTFTGSSNYIVSYEYIMTGYDPQSDNGDITINSESQQIIDFSTSILEILPDGKYKTNHGDIIKNDILSPILYESFIKSITDRGQTISYGKKTTDTIDTIYGKRHVTIQSLKIYKDSEMVGEYDVTYGDGGLIYSREGADYDSGIRQAGSAVLTGTSLIM